MAAVSHLPTCRTGADTCFASRIAAHLLACCLAIGLIAPCAALEPDRRLGQLQHSAWFARDGAPTEIVGITQTPDGFLWLGTTSGLFRFDGLKFERVDLFPAGSSLGHAQNISTLTLAPDGSLWIGFRLGGVLRWDAAPAASSASAHWYGTEAGLPNGTVFHLLQDRDGQVWAATALGLFALQADGRWSEVGPAQGLDGHFYQYLMQDAGGTLWLNGPNGRWDLRRPGASRFERAVGMDQVNDMSIDREGRRWLWDRDDRLRLADGPAAPQLPVRSIGHHGGGLRADRDGGIWLFLFDGGMLRLARPEDPASGFEHFDAQDGLSGDRVTASFVDRDGNLWVGTAKGLDRFRPARAVPAPLAHGLEVGVMAPLDDGSVVTGSIGQPPARLWPTGAFEALPGDYRPGETMFGAAVRAPDGTAWVGGIPDLWHLVDGRMQRVAAPADIAPKNPVQILAADAQGAIWAAWWATPLRRWNGTGWDAVRPAERGEEVMTAMLDDRGGFWRGLASGEVIRRDAAGEQRFDRTQGLALGRVLSLHARDGELWVGGELGAAQLLDGRFRGLQVEGEQGLRSVSGIVQSAGGDLWLNDESGILRIRRSDLKRWQREPQWRLPVERLDWRDGVIGPSPSVRGLPSATEGRDGRLWFSRNTGIYWVDPARPAAATAAPVARVTRVSVDDQPWPTSTDLQLPAGSQVVRIGYTAPLPGAPERVRFRHRLVGLDPGWQAPTERREAVFTHLPPGEYRFEVQAMDEGGRWQSAVAGMGFAVQPTLTQTGWFRALLAATAVVLGWLLYRWRMAWNSRRAQERIETRLAERERIARELHDTLLQSTMALTVQIEAASIQLPESDPLRRGLVSALDMADAAVAETRARVQDLRRHQQPEELSQALQAAVIAMRGAGHRPAVRGECIGNARALAPAVWQEAFRLGLEAAQNALRHAQAGEIRLTVRYGPQALALFVVDDGIGMDVSPSDLTPSPDGLPAWAKQARDRGHFGLVGLYERARHLGGQLDIESAVGLGTRVQLSLRASKAYLPGSRSWWPWSRNRKTTAG